MDTFRTIVPVQPAEKQADYHAPLVFAGSCFTENIGDWLSDLRLKVCVNPFGILYNPISICVALDGMISGHVYKESDLGFHNGRWFSFDHHGRFSADGQAECLERINSSLAAGAEMLRLASHLFITFGTALVYQVKTSGKIVANCHKIPDTSFSRRMLEVEEITGRMSEVLARLQQFNPDLRVIFSLSPVRHTRDGQVLNAGSKARLLVALHRIIDNHPNSAYFPAWEIMMDELRDYRFYADDMLHPSSVAIGYIREKFAQAWLSAETREIMSSMEPIVKGRQHVPVNRDSEEFRKFGLSMLSQTERLKTKFPFLDLYNDLEYFRGLIE